jgi:hypothetical protein
MWSVDICRDGSTSVFKNPPGNTHTNSTHSCTSEAV